MYLALTDGIFVFCAAEPPGKPRMQALAQNIFERIFKMLKLSTCKEDKSVAERQGREETLYPVTI